MNHLWRWWWGIGVPLGLLLGCAPRLVVQPWPCQRIAERPQVDAELVEMRAQGVYRATREWAVDADAVCAANRALRGEAAAPTVPWWQRALGWARERAW